MAANLDKRQNNRAPLITTINWTLDDRQWHQDTSQDVSPSGMMLRTPQAIAAGATVKLKFKLPNLKFQEPIVVSAEAVRVVQRHGRQIGVGLRFLSIHSQNALVVQEFVCRILGLPLAGVMNQLGSHDQELGYSFTMERLAREAEAKAVVFAAEQTAQATARQRQHFLKTWGARLLKSTLLLLGLLIVQQGIGLLFRLAARLQSVH